MNFHSIVFYIFAAMLVFSALRVITAKNPVHAAMFLVLSFFTAAGLWLLIYAEFLALALIMVYVGAVMVLFLFVVMMINLNMDGLRQGFWKHFPLAALIGVVIALEMSYVLMGGFREPPKGLTASQAAAGLSTNNTMELGKLLYTQYIYPLEIAAVILLVAIISAIALTLRRRKDSRAVDPSVQVVVKARDRMEVVKLEATKAPVAPVAVDTEAEKK